MQRITEATNEEVKEIEQSKKVMVKQQALMNNGPRGYCLNKSK